MPCKVIKKVIQFMFLGINKFWVHLRAHFNPCLTARARIILSQAQNIFIPANTNSIVFLSLLPMTCIVIGVSGEVVSSFVSFFNQRRCLDS